MSKLTRRHLLAWAALAPALPHFVLQRAHGAAADGLGRYDGRAVVVVHLRGGNDGLNTVVPVRDNRYYAARPSIAIARNRTLPLDGGDLGLHPSLADFKHLMDDGHAGIVQAVGYPESSRSHARATEIWETASLADATDTGWLGRYIDSACQCESERTAGVQFGDSFGKTLASTSGRSRLIGHPRLLSQLDPDAMVRAAAQGPDQASFAEIVDAHYALTDAARLVARAERASGGRYAYPDTTFGSALRWAGNMIETECPTRTYYLSVGSFEDGAASFDTHVDQLPQHERLYRELGQGLRAFVDHLRAVGHFDRVLFLTFSDFGRQLEENRTQGTEHGDASVLLYGGGAVNAGLQGQPPDLDAVANGGLSFRIDFRAIYAEVLSSWLGAPSQPLLDVSMTPFPLVRSA